MQKRLSKWSFAGLAAVMALGPFTTANAQYIARKLSQESYLMQPSGISGDRVVGTFGASYGIRNRYDGIVWDIPTGAKTFYNDGSTAFQSISGDWVIKDGGAFSIYTSYNPLAAVNLTTGQAFGLGYSASSQSSGYTATNARIRDGWAWSNTDNYLFGPYAYYHSFSSQLVNLITGETKSYSWDYAPFSSVQRQFVDLSGGKVLENTYGSYSLLDIDSGVRTDIAPALSSVVGMSGTKIAGNSAVGAALYDHQTGQTTVLSNAGVASTGMVAIGVNQSIGNAIANGSQVAVRWDNATGAVTNLQNYLPTGVTSSTAMSVDTANADGSILVQGYGSPSASGYYALRAFAGTVVGVGEGEIATFVDDYTQDGGIVSNGGTIQWTNPPHWWNIQTGLLTGSGYFYGNINNFGGTLSGGIVPGSFGGGGGGGGNGGGGGGYGGGGGAGSGIGAFSASGGYAQGATGTLLVTIGGPSAFDTFSFGGTATLGGLLEITLLQDYLPNYNQEFQFFAAPNLVGTWESIYSPGYRWDVRYTPTGATLIFKGAAVPEATTGLLMLGAMGTAAAVLVRRRFKCP